MLNSRGPVSHAPVPDVSSRCSAPIPTNASSRPESAKPNGLSRKATATAAGGLFLPQSKSLGLDQSTASPALQQKIPYAGTVSRSFAEGCELLEQLADLSVSAKQVERVARRIGMERVAERDAEVAAYRGLPLVEKFTRPAGMTASDLAVVMADGGRLQILDRVVQSATDPSPAAADAASAGAADETWEEEKPAAGHWREDKVGSYVYAAATAARSRAAGWAC